MRTHGGATVDLLRDILGDDELHRRRPAVIADGVPGGALTWLSYDGQWHVDRIATVDHLG